MEKVTFSKHQVSQNWNNQPSTIVELQSQNAQEIVGDAPLLDDVSSAEDKVVQT